MQRLLLVLALALLPAQSVLATICEYEDLPRLTNVAGVPERDEDARTECCIDLRAESPVGSASTHCPACSAGHASAPCAAGVDVAFESPQGVPAYPPSHYDPSLSDRIERVPLINA
jgi:hypothetical protein